MGWDYFNHSNVSFDSRYVLLFQIINYVYFSFNYFSFSLIFETILRNFSYYQYLVNIYFEIISISFYHFQILLHLSFISFYLLKNQFSHHLFQLLCFILCFNFIIINCQTLKLNCFYNILDLHIIYLNRYWFEINFLRKYISIIIMLCFGILLLTWVCEYLFLFN
jgi:hypothetical protein